jgi:FkbM family methyltransferase
MQMAENLGRLLAEDPVLHVEGYPGRFAIGPKSDILRRIVVSGNYEPALVQVCKAHVDPSRDAIDVGANVGLYSLLLADLIPKGRVLAIEPTPAALKRLRRNISMNQCDDRVIVFPGAAAASDVEVRISTVPGKEEYSTAGVLEHPSVRDAVIESINISARAVDTLVEELSLNPGFIKIDVEGMEHTVLAGMQSTIEKFRPVILAELSDPLLRRNNSSAREVLQLIARHSYVLSDPLAPGFPPGRRSYGDVLCIPAPPRSR